MNNLNRFAVIELDSNLTTRVSNLVASVEATMASYPTQAEWEREWGAEVSQERAAPAALNGHSNGESLSANPTISISAHNGEAAGVDAGGGVATQEEVEATGPAVVLVLASPENPSGLAAVRRCREVLAGRPVLAVYETATTDQAIEAMRAGAANVLMLDQPTDRLQSALSEAAEAGRQSAADNADAQRLARLLSTLTSAEVQVLEDMLAGMANKQIAENLSIGLRTVELRRSKIMRKMRAKSLAELVRLVCIAQGVGQGASGLAPASVV